LEYRFRLASKLWWGKQSGCPAACHRGGAGRSSKVDKQGGCPEGLRLNMANRPRVTGDKRVMGDEENALNLSLSDQQAVERILVQVG
jgi:hypothetical protein